MSSRRPFARAPHAILLLGIAAFGGTVVPAAQPPLANHASAAADTPWIAAPVGQFGGGILAMAVDVKPGIVWIGDGPRVEGIDVSDPRAPRVIGRTDWMNGGVTGLAVQGTTGVALTGYTWGDALADEDHTVHVVDLSEPTAPRVVGGLALAGAEMAVEIGHGHAYVLWDTNAPTSDTSSRRFKLAAIDIRDPHHPVLVNSDVVPGEHDIVDVRVAGDILAVTTRYAQPNASPHERYRLHLLRLADAASPTSVKVVEDDAWCRLGRGPGADVPGMLYGYGYNGGIVALDVTAPEAPREVKRWPASDIGPSSCGPLDNGPFLVDAAGSPFLQVFTGINRPGSWLSAVDAPPDASGRRPAHRFEVGAYAASLIGSNAIVAEVSGDITIVDTRAMTVAAGAADVVGSLPLLGWTGAIAVREDRDDALLYAAPVVGGLTTLSLDAPLDPPVVGRYVDGLERKSLHVAGGLAAIGRHTLAVDPGQPDIFEAEVLDVADPRAPKPRAVFGGGRFARLLSTTDGLSVVHGSTGDYGTVRAPEVADVDDPPSRPSTAIPIDMPLLDGVTVGERFVAVGSAKPSPNSSCARKRLSLWDLSDASHPRLEAPLYLGPCDRTPDRLVVAATDRLAFVGAALDDPIWPDIGRSQLTVVAFDDPTAPHVVANLPLLGTVTSLAVHDGFVYAAASCAPTGQRCVAVIDIRDPTAPRIVGSLDAAPDSWHDALAVRGGRVYVAASLMGILVFEPPLDGGPSRSEGRVALPWLGANAGMRAP